MQPGQRVCAFWSSRYSHLYAGHVKSISTSGLVTITFDDLDQGEIPVSDVRLLPQDHPRMDPSSDPFLSFHKGNGRNRITRRLESFAKKFDAELENYLKLLRNLADGNNPRNSKPRSRASATESPKKSEEDDWVLNGEGVQISEECISYESIRRNHEIIRLNDAALFWSGKKQGNTKPFVGRVDAIYKLLNQMVKPKEQKPRGRRRTGRARKMALKKQLELQNVVKFVDLNVVNVTWFYRSDETKRCRLAHGQVSCLNCDDLTLTKICLPPPRALSSAPTTPTSRLHSSRCYRRSKYGARASCCNNSKALKVSSTTRVSIV